MSFLFFDFRKIVILFFNKRYDIFFDRATFTINRPKELFRVFWNVTQMRVQYIIYGLFKCNRFCYLSVLHLFLAKVPKQFGFQKDWMWYNEKK